MPVTGIFFLPTQGTESPPTQTIINSLNAQHNPSLLPPWSLYHRLFRETPTAVPNGSEKGKSSGPRFLQVLSLQHHAPRTYVAITATTSPSQTRAGTPASSHSAETAAGEPATIISIPSGPPTEEFIQLIISKFGTLWQHRQVLTVTNGQSFEIGDFRIRVGEMRQGGGGGQMTRGAICEIEWVGGDEEGDKETDWDTAETTIRGFWEGLGIRGARSVFDVPGLALGESSVRQWCEILRVRG
ncbi:hypothetical protein P7C71_g5435, partial [Lecanoromycetidae sp. Uapishka_2]